MALFSDVFSCLGPFGSRLLSRKKNPCEGPDAERSCSTAADVGVRHGIAYTAPRIPHQVQGSPAAGSRQHMAVPVSQAGVVETIGQERASSQESTKCCAPMIPHVAESAAPGMACSPAGCGVSADGAPCRPNITSRTLPKHDATTKPEGEALPPPLPGMDPYIEATAASCIRIVDATAPDGALAASAPAAPPALPPPEHPAWLPPPGKASCSRRCGLPPPAPPTSGVARVFAVKDFQKPSPADEAASVPLTSETVAFMESMVGSFQARVRGGMLSTLDTSGSDQPDTSSDDDDSSELDRNQTSTAAGHAAAGKSMAAAAGNGLSAAARELPDASSQNSGARDGSSPRALPAEGGVLGAAAAACLRVASAPQAAAEPVAGEHLQRQQQQQQLDQVSGFKAASRPLPPLQPSGEPASGTHTAVEWGSGCKTRSHAQSLTGQLHSCPGPHAPLAANANAVPGCDTAGWGMAVDVSDFLDEDPPTSPAPAAHQEDDQQQQQQQHGDSAQVVHGTDGAPAGSQPRTAAAAADVAVPSGLEVECDPLELLEGLDGLQLVMSRPHKGLWTGLWQGVEVAVKALVAPAGCAPSGALLGDLMAAHSVRHRQLLPVHKVRVSRPLDEAALTQMGYHVPGARPRLLHNMPNSRLHQFLQHHALRPANCRRLPGVSEHVEAPQELPASSAAHSGGLHMMSCLQLDAEDSVVVLVSQKASMGALQDYCFAPHSPFQPSKSWPTYVSQRALLRTLREVAAAMVALHKRGITHGGLRPSNVLLQASSKDRRGFIALVGDMGLSPLVDVDSTVPISERRDSFVYTAPERMLANAGPAADVYSFGMLLYAMATAIVPHSEHTIAQVLVGVTQHQLRPRWPKGGVHDHLEGLFMHCCAQDPADRPSFKQVVLMVRELEHQTKLQKRLATHCGAGSCSSDDEGRCSCGSLGQALAPEEAAGKGASRQLGV